MRAVIPTRQGMAGTVVESARMCSSRSRTLTHRPRVRQSWWITEGRSTIRWICKIQATLVAFVTIKSTTLSASNRLRKCIKCPRESAHIQDQTPSDMRSILAVAQAPQGPIGQIRLVPYREVSKGTCRVITSISQGFLRSITEALRVLVNNWNMTNRLSLCKVSWDSLKTKLRWATVACSPTSSGNLCSLKLPIRITNINTVVSRISTRRVRTKSWSLTQRRDLLYNSLRHRPSRTSCRPPTRSILLRI